MFSHKACDLWLAVLHSLFQKVHIMIIICQWRRQISPELYQAFYGQGEAVTFSVIHYNISDSQPFQVNSPLCRSLIYHPPPPKPTGSGGWRPGYFYGVVHQEPNFERNFEIRCAGNACISIFVRSTNARSQKCCPSYRPSAHFGLGTSCVLW